MIPRNSSAQLNCSILWPAAGKNLCQKKMSAMRKIRNAGLKELNIRKETGIIFVSTG